MTSMRQSQDYWNAGNRSMVFMGGTCLSLIYSNNRFSEDPDLARKISHFTAIIEQYPFTQP